MSVPQVVDSFEDGTYMWQRGKEFACSWDGPFSIPKELKSQHPETTTPWLPTIAAARMAWEMSKPVREIRARYSEHGVGI